MIDNTVLSINYIVKTPGVLGGDPRIDGHRIGVELVADLYVNHGVSAEDIAESYALTLAEIYAALSYYYDHKAEIQAIWDEHYQIAERYPDDERTAKLRSEIEARARKRAEKTGGKADK